MVTTSHTQSIKDGRIGTLASSVFAAVAHITVPKHDTQSERKARRLRISEERRWGEGRWSVQEKTQRERIAACHWLLLRLAGVVPDDLTAQSRRWLGDGDVINVGRAISYAVLSARISLTDDDIDLLAELLGAAGLDNSELSMVDVLDSEPISRYAFVARRADADGAAHRSAADGRPRVPVITSEADDDVDRAVLSAMEVDSPIRALWRAWRLPGDGAPWPPPRRVYVVEVDQDVDLVLITALLQAVAAAEGESDPQIEVYPVHARLPSYQRFARAYGALLWTREPDPQLRLAKVFDEVDERGARIAPDHSVLESGHATKLAGYLRGGEPLLATTARMRDVVSPERGAVVPMNFRTDGSWIWSDGVTYYLEQYGLAPDAGLVAHIERLNFVAPEVDGAAIHRALAVLQEPSADEPAWLYPY